jgi:uncharacterized membrane protein YhaH (DUF805 family)
MQALALALRAYRDMLRFRGRATRTELLCFYLIASILQFPLVWLVDSILPDHGLYPYGWRTDPIAHAAAALAWLPIWALMVRRVHDYGWPAWTALLLLAALEAMSLVDLLIYPEPGKPWLFQLGGVSLIVFAWVMTLRPPDFGSNHYGEDPRVRAEAAGDPVGI